ncbi:MAG: nucleoside triphosphate pyrophosphohydrolase [Bacillota bacterium]|jgi:tetrapyrrole methylase family protein/MazG family protein
MVELFIVGLGPGELGNISVKSWRLLNSGLPVLLRTSEHPAVPELTAAGIAWSSCDDLYEQSASFADVYEAIWQRLQEWLQQHQQVIYAVPGHPLVGEYAVALILERAADSGLRVSLSSSMSSLEAVYEAVSVDPNEGLLITDALDGDELLIYPACNVIYLQVYDRLIASTLKLNLLEVYPDQWEVVIVQGAGTDQLRTTRLPLWQLDHQEYDHLTSVFVPRCPDVGTAGQRLEELAAVMETLRSPEGCPWDRQQTHVSLKPYLLEEAYEVLEAIDQNDMHKLADELGDLLLQVVFHAQIARENGEFALDKPIELIVAKLRRRHPHIFGDVTVTSAAEVQENWEKIKAEERTGQQLESLLATVPRNMPALLQAYKLQQKAAQVGFDWPDVTGAWAKVHEEMAEVDAAVHSQSPDQIRQEVGDLLFAVVNVARFLDAEPESALLSTISKFRRRFTHLENRAKQAGRSLDDYDLEQLDVWWEEAKHLQ